MLSLLIDTTAPDGVIALSQGKDLLATYALPDGVKAASSLHPSIAELCEQQDVALSDLSAVAVVTGPGAFTGVRVGLATAKAIAHARRIPLVGVSSLELLATPHLATEKDTAALIDARQQQVYLAVFGQSLTDGVVEQCVVSPKEALTQLQGCKQPLQLVGSGVAAYADVWAPLAAPELETFAELRMQSLAALTAERSTGLSFADSLDLLPNYVRGSYAER